MPPESHGQIKLIRKRLVLFSSSRNYFCFLKALYLLVFNGILSPLSLYFAELFIGGLSWYNPPTSPFFLFRLFSVPDPPEPTTSTSQGKDDFPKKMSGPKSAAFSSGPLLDLGARSRGCPALSRNGESNILVLLFDLLSPGLRKFSVYPFP